MNPFLKRFLKDWRNIALVVAVIAIVILAVSMHTAKTGGQALVLVNSEPITEGQLIGMMKKNYGNDALAQLIDGKVIRAFAKKKGVVATDAEIDGRIDIQRYLLKQQDMTLENWLAENGSTLDEYRQQVAQDVLRVKLIVPEADIKKIYAKEPAAFDFPPVLRIRLFVYGSEKDARSAIVELNKPDDGGGANAQKAAASALNGMQAMTAMTYRYDNPEITKALVAMQAQTVSAPIKTTMREAGNKAVWAVVQLLERTDGEKGTLENRRIFIGQQLLSDPKQPYAVQAAQMQAEALNAVDIVFTTSDYKKLQDNFSYIKSHNQQVPKANLNDMRRP